MLFAIDDGDSAWHVDFSIAKGLAKLAAFYLRRQTDKWRARPRASISGRRSINLYGDDRRAVCLDTYILSNVI